MKILRVYNNNVASVINEGGNEMIVAGRGIAFSKHAGDSVDMDRIEKVFYLKDPKTIDRFLEIVKGMPPQYVAIAEEIVETIKKKSGIELSDNIYITLTDHIGMSLEREKKGVIIKNPLLLEIKQYYKKEYELAKIAAEIINKELGILISDDETGFITLHIVNASMNQQLENTMKITIMMQDILAIVRDEYKDSIDENSIQYSRFVRHLQFLARKLCGEAGKEQSENELLYRTLSAHYPSVMDCVEKISGYLESKFGVTITRAEKGFMLYHILNVTSLI